MGEGDRRGKAQAASSFCRDARSWVGPRAQPPDTERAAVWVGSGLTPAPSRGRPKGAVNPSSPSTSAWLLPLKWGWTVPD